QAHAHRLEGPHQLVERFTEVLAGMARRAGLPLDAREEDVRFLVDVLVEVDDVAAVLVDEAGERGDDAGAVRAGEAKDGVHGLLRWAGARRPRDGSVRPL